ncbi:winged helix DNA-binding domain-containing protein [Rhodococcus sp. NPDC058532]|uniref:winged helix DNA-binding domain-containing protein n=1 Tax=Rhodococcus sp. NPDC058532 TaxID=3346540 RepID=UPI003648B348
MSRRHPLSRGGWSATVTNPPRGLVCLHATDPATVYLSARARVDGMTVGDLDRALYEERSLVRHLAMRRTQFVFPRETLPAAQAGASGRVADRERRSLVRDVEKAGLFGDGARWLDEAGAAVLGALADGAGPVSYRELKAAIPVLAGAIVHGEGKSWGGKMSIGPRVLTVLSAEGLVVRAGNDGSWWTSRNRWATTESWLGSRIASVPEGDGTARLVAEWLRAFGPGTEADLKWWLGSTLTAVRQALSVLDVARVDLDGGVGYLLADDLAPVGAVEPWAALLPGLDPTTMGWRERDWYLGSYQQPLFDSVGNAGPTAWWDGRIVGGWWQDEAGRVVVHLLEDVGVEAERALAAEADALTEWLGGVRVMLRFPSPLSKQFA